MTNEMRQAIIAHLEGMTVAEFHKQFKGIGQNYLDGLSYVILAVNAQYFRENGNPMTNDRF